MELRASLTGADLEALTASASKSLLRAQRQVGRDIAKVARRAVLDDVRKSRRGGLRFGTNRATGGRYKLGARSTIEAHGDRVEVVLTAVPAGFWSIVEYGSSSHEIAPRFRRALHFDELYSAHAFHPGTSGRPVWAGAETALDRAVFPVIEDAFDDALLEAA